MTTAKNGCTKQDYVDAGGLRTYYEVHGLGEPSLVLLHGGLCTIETFADLTRAVGRTTGFTCRATRAWPHPGCRRTHHLSAMAQDSIAFLEAVGLPAAHLVGWSDGAVVALLVALRRPDLVRRLVLIGQFLNPDGSGPEDEGHADAGADARHASADAAGAVRGRLPGRA